MYAQVARYCNHSADLIPLSFVLGKAPRSPWYSPYHLPRPLGWVDSSEGQNYPSGTIWRSTRIGSEGMGAAF